MTLGASARISNTKRVSTVFVRGQQKSEEMVHGLISEPMNMVALHKVPNLTSEFRVPANRVLQKTPLVESINAGSHGV